MRSPGESEEKPFKTRTLGHFELRCPKEEEGPAKVTEKEQPERERAESVVAMKPGAGRKR